MIFSGVELIVAPRHLVGVELVTSGPDDVQAAVAALNRNVSIDRVFVLLSQCQRYIVVAAALNVDENEREIFDSPFV